MPKREYAAMRLTAEAARKLTGGVLVRGSGDETYSSVTTDSRSVSAGDLFIGIRGDRFDGNEFARGALAAGAIGALVDDDSPFTAPDSVPPGKFVLKVDDSLAALADLARHRLAAVNPVVVAVTGSVGKTTVKEILYHIVRDSIPSAATPGNFNNHIGLPLSVLGLFGDENCVILEMGASAAGEIADLCRIARPDIGIITGVARAHIEGFGTLEGVVSAKAELAEALPEDGLLILDDECEWADEFARKTKARTVRISAGDSADEDVILRADCIELAENGYQFRINDRVDVSLPLLGRHSITNALLATAAAIRLGIELEEAAKRLSSFAGISGRLFPISANGVLLIDDTYNANPDSALAGIEALKDTGRPRICVLGDMAELGEDSASLHAELGKSAANARLEALVFVGSMAPEGERGAFEAGIDREKVLSFPDKKGVAEAVVESLPGRGTVLVKGSRSAGMDQIVRELRELLECRCVESPAG